MPAHLAPSRTILVAGAGIGGLTAALCLAERGYRVVIAEQAQALTGAGAGLQLSPNATRILTALGLAPALSQRAVVPAGLSVCRAATGEEIVFMPLGAEMEFRYGSPYWVLHRGDLQAVLADAAAQQPDISLRLSTKLDDFVLHAHGITTLLRDERGLHEERVLGLIGADGLWSQTRVALGDRSKPRFANRTAWRATLAPDAVPDPLRRLIVSLWLGPDAHVVLYPVRGGRLFNIVAIVRDRWHAAGWSAPGDRDELLRRFGERDWNAPVRELLRAPERWLKWALFDRPEAGYRGRGAVTLLGDAAHPMLPFLAQGAGMAIEDAAVLARCLSRRSDDPALAMRRYEAMRLRRVRRVQRGARANASLYHRAGWQARLRDLALRRLGGNGLRARYNWLYDWRCD